MPIGAAPGRCGGDEAGAAGDVEQTRARRRADRVEQRVVGLDRDDAERVGVVSRGDFPTALFELMKWRGIERLS